MIVFPNAKINLGLRILNRRTDGYHNLQSYMVPVNFCDALEIVPSRDGFSFSASGIPIQPSPKANLCVQAYQLMKENYNTEPVKMHLHKLIPPGSGLGGGSSDAAFALTLLRKIYRYKFCDSELEGLAALIGSDCPFFISNRPQLIQFTGTPSHKFLRLKQYHIAIIIPKISISTAWAYSIIKPSGKELPDAETIIGRENEWWEMLVNDFEEPIFGHYPELKDIKEKLFKAGAFYASLSGSGSALYGLFSQEPDINGLFDDCFTWKGQTLE